MSNNASEAIVEDIALENTSPRGFLGADFPGFAQATQLGAEQQAQDGRATHRICHRPSSSPGAAAGQRTPGPHEPSGWASALPQRASPLCGGEMRGESPFR